MNLIVQGKTIPFLCTLIMLAIFTYFTQRGRKGIGSKVYRIPQLDAIDEAVGRAAEMDRPVHITAGRGELLRGHTPVLLAGMEVCAYTAQLCARTGVKCIFTCADAALVPIAEEKFKSAYIKEKAIENYEKDVSIFFYPRFSWNMAVWQLISDYNIGANIWVGFTGFETVFIAERARSVGAIQIGGTHRPAVVVFMVACCDYTLICEDIYAADAYLTKNPIATSNIEGQDWCKLGVLVILLALVFLLNLGVNVAGLWSL